MNRRGAGEELMLFPFLIIAGILISGVVWGVVAFNGKGYEFRAVESSLLRDKVVSCFDRLNNVEIMASDFNVRFADLCDVNGEVLAEEHIVKVNGKEGEEILFLGVRDYENQCFFEGGEKNSAYPVCVRGEFSKGADTYEYIIGSNQRGRRVLT